MLRLPLWALLIFPGACTFSRIVYHNFSTIDDWKIFPSRPLPAAAQPWKLGSENAFAPEVPAGFAAKFQTFEQLLSENNTTAFLVLKNQKLVYEKYLNGAAENTISLAFSMSKSYFSMLFGRALEEGWISGVNDPVANYIPELVGRGYDRVTLENLLNMTSGSDYSDSDNPIGGDAPWYYYDKDLEQRALTQKVTGVPGAGFNYKSADTALLGVALRRRLKKETITEYFRRSIWEKMGAEYAGSWSVDNDNGIEKVYCCLTATARDFIKLGALSIDGKNWRGNQVVPVAWLKESRNQAKALNAGELRYRYQWWLPRENNGTYFAIGHLGQYTLVNPRTQVVVLRLGKSEGNLRRDAWLRMMETISNSL